MALRSQQPGIEPRGGHGYGLGVVAAEVAHGAPRLKPVSGACGGDAYSSMVCCLAHSGCAKAVQKMVNAAPMIHTGKCAKANNVCTGAQASCQLLPQWNSWEDGQWARSCGRLGDAGVVHTHTHTHTAFGQLALHTPSTCSTSWPMLAIRCTLPCLHAAHCKVVLLPGCMLHFILVSTRVRGVTGCYLY